MQVTIASNFLNYQCHIFICMPDMFICTFEYQCKHIFLNWMPPSPQNQLCLLTSPFSSLLLFYFQFLKVIELFTFYFLFLSSKSISCQPSFRNISEIWLFYCYQTRPWWSTWILSFPNPSSYHDIRLIGPVPHSQKITVVKKKSYAFYNLIYLISLSISAWTVCSNQTGLIPLLWDTLPLHSWDYVLILLPLISTYWNINYSPRTNLRALLICWVKPF